jgi:hypothetical protein
MLLGTPNFVLWPRRVVPDSLRSGREHLIYMPVERDLVSLFVLVHNDSLAPLASLYALTPHLACATCAAPNRNGSQHLVAKIFISSPQPVCLPRYRILGPCQCVYLSAIGLEWPPESFTSA